MDAQTRPPRRLLSRLALLAVGIALGAGLAAAHFTGRLTPLYHRLGFHSLHGGPDQPEGGEPMTGAAHAGHAGHGGMSMPQAGSGEPSTVPGYTLVQISPERQQLIGVRTGKVTKDRLLMSLRAVGIIEPDQTRLARVQTRISGWVTKVHVNFVGQTVKKGDPLLDIYSPDLLATQEEYLLAVDAGQKPLAESARRRLELWGVPQDELKELERTKKAREALTLRSPIGGRVLERNALEGTRVEPAVELYRIADLSVVWLQAKIYEYELPHVEIGQPVRIALASQPEKEIKGKVSFVEPVFQEASRTVKVRVEIKNPDDQFKPGMYADLIIEHDMGEGLLVPESALLRTGLRNLAFRVLPGNRFEPVEVTLGSQFNERLQVRGGLSEGDEIVISAGFLIDAESRLKSATSAMTGHQHGGGAPPEKEALPPAPKDGGEKKPGAEHEHHHHGE
ncbi:MAG TPA: efflux RND transporter periplasmic adaptor subunit [Gemmataceae bacterium]|nr:efflux RND transporter periplasmic adaptor subunit [Gemmataceae bacterium]